MYYYFILFLREIRYIIKFIKCIFDEAGYNNAQYVNVSKQTMFTNME